MARSVSELTSELLRVLRDKNAVLSLAESCTGGMIASAITDIAGSSEIFDRCFVTYSNNAKVEMIGISPKTISEFGAVSEEVALQMAEGALSRSDATIALSVTGIAGPGGSEHKPEGRVCFGISTIGTPTETVTKEFGALGRGRVREAACVFGLSMIINAATRL